ncbi:protein kinase [Pedobacter sp. MC2016-24]|uniref:serine/threonine protein kinase n=1 Tax=Pedobacter sp. MC2016-24 TaxID=2780090 RepID=UPI001881B3AC|nr:protein kinase [Pedobacter sp. MC2016-24]MBE9601866.1 protein kinase [Pedobacter sp. MC2016-24]
MNQMNLTSALQGYPQLDHTEFLNELDTPYTCDEYYIKVDFDQLVAERVIFISGILSQLTNLVEAVIPYLVSQKISFNLVKNQQAAKLVLNANFGEQHIGKLILIYLSADIDQDELVAALVILTTDFKGPAIPGHQHMGGTVYAKQQDLTLPVNTKKQVLNLKGNCLVTATLKPDPKGDVLKGLYLNKYLFPTSCVIKQGRYCMWSDEDGRDIQDRLKWQFEVHTRLSDLVKIPKIIAEFKEKDDHYLIMEFIKGIPFNQVLEDIYRFNCWLSLSDRDKWVLLDLLRDVFEMVCLLHSADYVHRDLTPGNFMLKKSRQLFMIDLELLYDLESNFPSPAFKLGTAGFMSPEQWMAQVPTVKEDIYALGGFMIMCFTGLAPAKFELEKSTLLSQRLTELKVDAPLIKLILHCVQNDPGHRPSIVALIQMFEEAVSLLPFNR